LIDWS